MSKHQNETISSRESHVCHLTHAGQTARFWQFGRPVLGGNFWFPRWNSFILVFWHLYKAYLNVFTWICLLTFFLPYVSFKPTVFLNYSYFKEPLNINIHWKWKQEKKTCSRILRMKGKSNSFFENSSQLTVGLKDT